MSAIRRFMNFEDDISIFQFKINTNNIVVDATDGSQNPLSFRLPITLNSSNSFILRVSDGRPDVTINASSPTSALILNFNSPGIYDITLIGNVGFFQPSNLTVGYDRLKFIEINHWGNSVAYQHSCFNNCSNLEFLATNVLTLPVGSNTFFANTKGFPNKDLSNIQFTKVTSATQILNNVPTQFTSLFNPFMPNILSVSGLYSGVDIQNVSKIEIISDSVTTVNSLFSTPIRNFNGELILATPNNTGLQAFCYYLTTTPSLAKVDVRNVTNTLNHIRYPLTTSRMDDTLLGWASLPYMQNGVTWDWKGSKYSNNPAVIAAYNKITNDWGVIFTNLTME